MLTEERQAAILALLEKQNAVSVTALAGQFGCSDETVRRDLLALERQQRLIRVHGGAMSVTRTAQFRPFEERHAAMQEEKHALCAYAAGFVQEGDTIALDPGSTSTVFCQELTQRFHHLTVVINSPGLMKILAANPGFRVILCGGEYDREEDAFTGVLTQQALAQLHVSKAFITADGLSLQQGVTAFRQEGLPVQQALIGMADKVFLLADSSKFTVFGTYRITPLTGDMTVITDRRLPRETYEAFLAAEMDILMVGGDAPC